ncbi:DNA recombination protein RmuC [Blastococcus sp. Marseille-P5729]|uniref:DNA recombination protein RmuC n=1 Tax=Blastococcus sp. Marseille-P5729 TaxID=2086582 RepID=UPI00131ADCEA|nr:DNA recombination protein RmuC [Blastococcus sp. Marseille-P5729]
MEFTTLIVLLIALLCLALGSAAGYWAGRRATPADPPLELGAELGPLRETLSRVEGFLQSNETERAKAQGELSEQVRAMHAMQSTLGTQTTALVNALRAPHVRGRWGEMQLRRIVESAGMIDHCDFTEQYAVRGDDRGVRPDLVVHLTHSRAIAVDAKVPFTAFIESIDADDRARAGLVREHAKQVRAHLDLLSSKGYQDALDDSPDFTVMFLPSDAFLQLALQHEPALLERGFDRNVVIATPSTLLALLRTVAHTWRQDTVGREAKQILALGQQLGQRIGTFTAHLAKVGSSLESSVKSYNSAVGSLERNLLSTSRRLHELGATSVVTEVPESIDRAVRELHVADPPSGSKDPQVPAAAVAPRVARATGTERPYPE